MTDEITEAFQRAAGRPPREGDFCSEPPQTASDPDTGTSHRISRCWAYQAGRWEGFISESPPA